MALTLPYPDLDFVPLDVLTADEMNQIVANYTYISNQFPITSENIDFTTSSHSITPNSQYISLMGTTRVQQFGQIVFVSMGFSTGSATVPAGTTIFTGLPAPSSSQVNVTGMVGGTVARFALDGFGNFIVGGTSNALPALSAGNFSFCYIT